jgi:hypothetical protein
MSEPTSARQGDTIKWQRTLSDYPSSDGWALSYTFLSASGIQSVAATGGDLGVYDVAITATQSDAWPAEIYQWAAKIKKGSGASAESYTLFNGTTRILPNLANLTSGDARSHAVRTLEAIEATIEGRATSATAEYQIAGRAMKYIPFPELLSLRSLYRAEVARESAVGDASPMLPTRGRIEVRFGPV